MLRGAASFLLPALSAAIFGGLSFAPAAKAQSENYVVTVDEAQRVLTVPRHLPDCRPSGSEEEIVICANPREQQRYRLPREAWNPDGPVQSVSRERHSLYEQGDSGIGSCSTVGPGGWTGCAFKAWKAAREQHNR